MKSEVEALLRKVCLASLAMVMAAAPAYAQDVTVTGRVDVPKETQKAPQGDANVVVWLTPLARQPESMPLRQRLRLIQKNKSFIPHVLVVTVGSVVEFPNQDPFFHNVFSLFEGKRFDLGLYESGGTRLVRFDRPGICYIFCNIHPEMSAVVVVLNTPYYGVSDRTGQVRIANVPAGRYVLHMWHEGSNDEDLKNLTREITISAPSHSLGVLRVPGGNAVRLAHKNKYGRDYDNPNPASPAYDHP